MAMAIEQIPILMYHSIGESGSPRFGRFAVSLSSFEAQVRFALARYLVRDNWDTNALAAVLEGRPPLLPNLYEQARSRAWGAIRQSVQGFYQ